MLFACFFSGCGLVHPSLLQQKTRMGVERGKKQFENIVFQLSQQQSKKSDGKMNRNFPEVMQSGRG